MRFSTPFLFHKIEVYVALIHIFQILASGKRAIIFILTSKLANSIKKCETFHARLKYAN